MGDLKKQEGFTLIELMLVVAIVGILVGMAVSVYVGNIGDIKLRSDVRNFNQALQLAKMRAMSTGVPHGVAIDRRGSDTNPTNPARYFVFSDCDRNYLYTDNDANPDNNTPLTTMEKCVPGGGLGYDPVASERGIMELEKGDYLTTFLGTTSPTGAPLESVVFDILGQCYQGTGNLIQGPIYFQNDAIVNGQVARSGVQIMGGTGVTKILLLDRVSKDAWH